MNEAEDINYNRISRAIEYIGLNFKTQPDLDRIAEKVHLSPFHFQRLFSEWAGVSPKKFLQYISVEYAKGLLQNRGATLFDAALETGLSGTGRLHDLFVKIEAMTPGEFKNGGENLSINYNVAHSPFGSVLVASTTKGVCAMQFVDDEQKGLADLRLRFPNAVLLAKTDAMQKNALDIFSQDWSRPEQVKLHLKGSDFQLKVWETLLKIPLGQLSTYSSVAGKINQPNASRVVGTAIGRNPVAFLIPCHRVIQSSGALGGYMWGVNRKAAMIGWEAGKIDATLQTATKKPRDHVGYDKSTVVA
jgi:AraC family transcriptional regulator of adaptative response/methylated-DNA-[protein]-cysteine methyltransferase